MKGSTDNLQEWLSWQESLHFSAIDLGLDRIRQVAANLDLLQPDFPIITVAGTNGKGSTVALLTSILSKAGYHVGTYTSPHILRYNERIAFNGQPVDDAPICEAFEAIDAARGEISLTYFEFGTLAAMWLFARSAVDVVVLEVGLGGRLDAANLWDAEVAVVTSIGIDHVSWLGDDREVIGREKAGVGRPGKALVCGDPEPPESIAAVAGELGADYVQYGADFFIRQQDTKPSASALPCTFDVVFSALSAAEQVDWLGLPLPGILGEVQMRNAACALIALYQLRDCLPIQLPAIHQGVAEAQLSGRLQKLSSRPDILLDVAHNPHAAEQLAGFLQKNPTDGKNFVLFSILSDKDINGVLTALKDAVDEWHYFPLKDERAMPLSDIQSAMSAHGITFAASYAGLKQAWAALHPNLNSDDRVVAFGSFLVVSSMLEDLP
uniref:Dihydrofolate synthase/folylpolyglutamate synthase n=1 Tax=uncultured Thiotrichaceae bacterium TaxID=298394 RepID=A0A6S6TS94_9GAMM|nr:MAG: Dihydrofolate synthase (EC @ Folylpolyglutamate synthase (EC [uncultured Thiotrichaceae bacterium]